MPLPGLPFDVPCSRALARPSRAPLKILDEAPGVAAFYATHKFVLDLLVIILNAPV